MASLEKLMITLRQKKQEATNLRKKAERQLQQVRSLEKRSSSGLNSIDRKIESEKEDVTDVSGVLNQKTSQLESIERLIVAAHERLNREKEALSEAEQELEFAKNLEEEQSVKARLSIIHDRIQELEFEIKNREKTAKKIGDDVAKYHEIKSKISTTIQKQSKSKPSLRETLSASHKAAEKFVRELEQKTRAEESAAKALEKVTSNFQALLAKKRKPSQKRKSV
ncbi:MAG: ATPase V, partial [Thermoproteota archaeon]